MPLGLILGIGRAFRRKRTSSLDILSSKRAPRDYYKGKNCKSTGFHTRKGGYVLMQEKLPNYLVPDLTDFKGSFDFSICGQAFYISLNLMYPSAQEKSKPQRLLNQLNIRWNENSNFILSFNV
ncbi:uncharacterized protein LOC111301469 isoform X1 [Durio zibethinus]|uniref:Uncharacterized protein LOC111301469 isoform X1 n=1 Tax=Durio zibethinus TaxID=66656 RepID=A0A6P5ZK51_DURZI|nr:uncharacterized protein LOC111301469 isoform X1 [Durio zibethinus]XP_022752897.1 uncharacterized protein LOC111301469 isoform X1 [Durio zibethinus]